MAWAIEYTQTAKNQLAKLDRPIARRVLDYMDQRIAPMDDARSAGKVLNGALGGLWRYRVGDIRIICEIQGSTLRILVLEVGNRREIYR